MNCEIFTLCGAKTKTGNASVDLIDSSVLLCWNLLFRRKFADRIGGEPRQ